MGRDAAVAARTASAARGHATPSQPEAIDCGEIRRTLSGAITDEQLMPEDQGLCSDGTCTTRADQLRDGDQQVDGEDKEFAHGANRNHERQGAQRCVAHADSPILRIRHPQVEVIYNCVRSANTS